MASCLHVVAIHSQQLSREQHGFDTVAYTQGDSDVIPMPAGFRRHLVGKTLRNVFHCDIAEIRFVGKLVIVQTFS